MRYIYILEGKIGRLDYKITPSNFGLCTDQFTSCNIIVLISRDKQRYVLIHADRSLSPPLIKKEMDWVGVGSLNWVYRRASYSTQEDPAAIGDVILGEYQKSFKVCELAAASDDTNDTNDTRQQEVISINRGDVAATVSKKLPSDVAYHPRTGALLAHQILEGAIGAKEHLSQLMYDVNGWAKYETIKISQKAKSTLQNEAISKISPASDIYLQRFKKLCERRSGLPHLYEPNSYELNHLLNHASAIHFYYFLLAPADRNTSAYIKYSFDLFKYGDLENCDDQLKQKKIDDLKKKYELAKNFDEIAALSVAVDSELNDELNKAKAKADSGLDKAWFSQMSCLQREFMVVANASYVFFKRWEKDVAELKSHEDKKSTPSTQPAKTTATSSTTAKVQSTLSASTGGSSASAAKPADMLKEKSNKEKRTEERREKRKAKREAERTAKKEAERTAKATPADAPSDVPAPRPSKSS